MICANVMRVYNKLTSISQSIPGLCREQHSFCFLIVNICPLFPLLPFLSSFFFFFLFYNCLNESSVQFSCTSFDTILIIALNSELRVASKMT